MPCLPASWFSSLISSTPSSSRPSRADGLAAVEGDLDFLGLVGGQPGVGGPLERLGRRLDPGVFEDARLDRAAPEVLVGAEDRLLGRLDLDAVLGGELEFLGARPLPLADRGDDLQLGCEGLEGHVEPDLIVPLARAAVRDRRRPVLPRDPDHELRDQRAAQRRRQRILPLVEGAGGQRGEDEVVHEEVARVLGDRVDRAGPQRLLADRLDVLPLAQVAGVGDHVHVVRLVDPLDGHGRIQPAAVGQDHLVSSPRFDLSSQLVSADDFERQSP